MKKHRLITLMVLIGLFMIGCQTTGDDLSAKVETMTFEEEVATNDATTGINIQFKEVKDVFVTSVTCLYPRPQGKLPLKLSDNQVYHNLKLSDTVPTVFIVHGEEYRLINEDKIEIKIEGFVLNSAEVVPFDSINYIKNLK